jgi:hypothetical protein
MKCVAVGLTLYIYFGLPFAVVVEENDPFLTILIRSGTLGLLRFRFQGAQFLLKPRFIKREKCVEHIQYMKYTIIHISFWIEYWSDEDANIYHFRLSTPVLGLLLIQSL